METSSLLLQNLPAFLAEFNATFGDIDKARTSATKLRALRQGSRPVATYAAEFRQLACDINWGEAALVDQFQFGLHDDVKDVKVTAAMEAYAKCFSV